MLFLLQTWATIQAANIPAPTTSKYAKYARVRTDVRGARCVYLYRFVSRSCVELRVDIAVGVGRQMDFFWMCLGLFPALLSTPMHTQIPFFTDHCPITKFSLATVRFFFLGFFSEHELFFLERDLKVFEYL